MSEAKAKIANKKLKAAYSEIERNIVRDDKIVKEVIDEDTQKQLVRQISNEYDLAFKFNENKRSTQLARLKLYNNQRRVQSAVGDPLMFTVFNTILASLYDDELIHTWEGREEGDEEVEDNLNAMATHDYDVMGKAEMDYYWDWDACFFGRGLVLQMDFDRTKGIMAPAPEIIDPTVFIRDPKATSVNGTGKGHKGALRFGGFMTGATYYELKNSPGYFNIKSLRKDREVRRSLMDEASEARNDAQSRDSFYAQEEALGKYENYEFQLLNWFTHIKGRKYLVTLGNQRNTLVRLIDVDKYSGNWPITDRTIYPMSHDWDGVSIPDLTEDKQRARALLLNLGLKSAKSEAMPQYLFDQTKIKNKNDLNWKHDKFIGVDGRVGDETMRPVNKATVHQHVNVIMDILDTASQRALATPDIQQGIQSEERRTLGEINLVSSKVDTRYSLSAKVFGWSERAYWRQWYRQHKLHLKNKIDEKVVRIRGPLAPAWRKLKRDNVISQIDPDVRIESKVISEAKRIRQQQGFAIYASVAIQNPDNDRRMIERHLGKLNGLTKEELEMFHPKTIDELQAERENELLADDKIPTISVHDDHQTHIRIHAKANDTPESRGHIRAHQELALIRRARPELFGPIEEQQQQLPENTNQFEPVTDQRAGVGLPNPTSPTQ